MGKYKKIYRILNCSIDLPINDIDGWKMNKEHRWIYNKMRLCEFQGIEHAPMPIEPSTYPVIIKPIINLYGMGLNIIKVNNQEEFYDYWYNNNFWMKFLEGEHLSWDLVILNGKIKFHTCFVGHKDEKILGKFDFWESVTRDIPDIIKKLVYIHFREYSGCLNIETINNIIIEAHLRIGDIDCFPTLDILKGIIATYQKKEYNWDGIKLEKVFFFPVWHKEHNDNIYQYLEEKIAPLLDNTVYVHDYDIDNTSLSSPSSNHKRVMWFTCSYKEYGESIRKSINEKILKLSTKN